MTRGMRAIHGAEVDGDYHSHDATTVTIVVSRPMQPLEVTCWCERKVVLVPQTDVRWGHETRSCGRPGCVGPDGDHTPGPIVKAGYGASFKWDAS